MTTQRYNEILPFWLSLSAGSWRNLTKMRKYYKCMWKIHVENGRKKHVDYEILNNPSSLDQEKTR